MLPARAQRVTLQTVAAELGVSAKTVSNAYNAPDQLSAGLRDRVLEVAARLGYAGPDPLAAGLRRGRVGAIGVAYDNGLSYAFEDPVSVDLLAGIAREVEPVGAGLLLIPGSSDDARRVGALGGALLDGLVLASLADDDPLLAAATARGTPLAVVDQPRPASLDGHRAAWVGVDDRAAAAEIGAHVLGLRHRRLAVLSFGLHRLPVSPGLVGQDEQQRATYAVSRERLAGFRDAVEVAGLDWRTVPVWHAPDSTPDDGTVGARALLDLPDRPTAILCTSDRLAEGVLRVAADRRLGVPDDLSVTGFDDATTAAGLGLTTVAQPTADKGSVAARSLLRLVSGGPTPGPVLLPTHLVVRSSTATPPGG